jgi:hypothetical protein
LVVTAVLTANRLKQKRLDDVHSRLGKKRAAPQHAAAPSATATAGFEE